LRRRLASLKFHDEAFANADGEREIALYQSQTLAGSGQRGAKFGGGVSGVNIPIGKTCAPNDA